MVEYIPAGAKRILDIGCGEGKFAHLLKQKLNAEVWGIEINELAASKASTGSW
jgi:tRNA1(Val) A37 N6-methylase TrmN6